MSSARILRLFSLSYIPSELPDTLCPVAEFYPPVPARNFEEHGLSYEQWKSVLHLSTRWGFASLRKLALKSIHPPTSFNRLLLARTYSVDHWVLPALSALCERTKPISLKEARQMDMEDVVLVATVREEIRTRGPFVDTTIKDRIQATQDRMVAHLGNDDNFAVDSESEADERVSLKGAVTGIGAKADSYNGTKNIAGAIPPKVVDVHGSGEHSVSPCALWPENH
jgi:hypothetical protein